MTRLPDEILGVCYLDGAFMAPGEARVSAFDRGFLVADGIFETLYVAGGAPLFLDEHLARFARSAAYVRLDAAPDAAALTDIVRALLARNGLDGAASADEAALRLTVSRGVSAKGPPTVFGYLRRLTPGHLAKRSDGVVGFVLPFTRAAVSEDLAMHKTLAYLASSLGQLLLAGLTPDPRAEGFFVDRAGRLLEGTGTNLFIVEGDAVVTAPVSLGVLPGTARAAVLELASELGWRPVEEGFDAARLRRADEVFVTSSTLRVAPVVSLDGRVVGGGAPGPAVKRLQAAFEQRVAAEVAHWHARAD